MAEDVAKLYTQQVLKSAGADAVSWMHRDEDGDLMIGINHHIASAETSRLELENAVQNLWQFGGGPRQVDARDFAGQHFGMELRSRRVPCFVGYPAADLISPEMTLNPARLNTRSNPNLFVLAPWQIMADEAQEMFNLPFGDSFNADFYQGFSTFRLDQDAIGEMTHSDTKGAITKISGPIAAGGMVVSDFRRFDDYPIDARMALLDLVNQVGAEKLASYSVFRMTVSRGDWKAAADNCPDIAEPKRTRWRREMFMKAFAQSKAKAPPAPQAAVAPPATPKPKPPVR